MHLDGTVLSTQKFMYSVMQNITLLMSSLGGLQRASQSVVMKQFLSCSFGSSVHTFTNPSSVKAVSTPMGCTEEAKTRL